MLIKNIPNADELIKLMEQHKLPDFPYWRIRVDHNPHGNGIATWLRAFIDCENLLSTYFNNQNDVDGIDYAWSEHWRTSYKGTFQLDTTPFQNIKPEVYKVGDTVEVLEVAKEAGNYEKWPEIKKKRIGKTFTIDRVCDNNDGISYFLDGGSLPHYAVRKVVDLAELEPKPKPPTIITIGGEKYKLIEE